MLLIQNLWNKLLKRLLNVYYVVFNGRENKIKYLVYLEIEEIIVCLKLKMQELQILMSCIGWLC